MVTMRYKKYFLLRHILPKLLYFLLKANILTHKSSCMQQTKTNIFIAEVYFPCLSLWTITV